MPNESKKTIYTGTFISTPTLNSLQVLENHAVGVDESGTIRHVCPLPSQDFELADLSMIAEAWGWGPSDDGETTWLWRSGGNGRSSWWFPGFVGK